MIILNNKGGDVDCNEVTIFAFGYFYLVELAVFGQKTVNEVQYPVDAVGIVALYGGL